MYRKVDTRIWLDRKVHALTPIGKLVFLFLLTHPELTQIGAMRATLSTLATDLDLDPDAFKDGFEEGVTHGMIAYDGQTRCLVLPNFLKYNPPSSPNAVKSWVSCLDRIPECELKDQLIQRCHAYLHGMRQAFKDALPHGFIDAFSQPSSTPSLMPSGTPSPKPKMMPSLMPSPIQNQNQKQEQEQEQKQEQELMPSGMPSSTPSPMTPLHSLVSHAFLASLISDPQMMAEFGNGFEGTKAVLRDAQAYLRTHPETPESIRFYETWFSDARYEHEKKRKASPPEPFIPPEPLPKYADKAWLDTLPLRPEYASINARVEIQRAKLFLQQHENQAYLRDFFTQWLDDALNHQPHKEVSGYPEPLEQPTEQDI